MGGREREEMGGKEHGRWRGRSDERESWGDRWRKGNKLRGKEGKIRIERGRERDEQTNRGGKTEGEESIFQPNPNNHSVRYTVTLGLHQGS